MSNREIDRATMQARLEKLNWEWSEEGFAHWYDNSKYAAKAICAKIREKYL